MESEESYSLLERVTPVQNSIIRIGTSAVPYLIEAILEAESTASSLLGSSSSGLSDTQKEAMLRSFTNRIQVRAVMVLGEIRDNRALSTLYDLLNSTDDKALEQWIRLAIDNIETANERSN